MKEMGLLCQSDKSLSSLLPPHYHQHSDSSNAEKGIGGRLGDGDILQHNRCVHSIASISDINIATSRCKSNRTYNTIVIIIAQLSPTSISTIIRVHNHPNS